MKPIHLLIFLLILSLGFSSACKKDEPHEIEPPRAYFYVMGEVKSASENKLIPEIIVEMRNVQVTTTGDSIISLVATGFVDFMRNGYYLRDICTSKEDRTYQLRFTDTDGALNGEFETLDTIVVFNDPVFEGGDGASYLGSTDIKLNVTLKPKQ